MHSCWRGLKDTWKEKIMVELSFIWSIYTPWCLFFWGKISYFIFLCGFGKFTEKKGCSRLPTGDPKCRLILFQPPNLTRVTTRTAACPIPGDEWSPSSALPYGRSPFNKLGNFGCQTFDPPLLSQNISVIVCLLNSYHCPLYKFLGSGLWWLRNQLIFHPINFFLQ